MMVSDVLGRDDLDRLLAEGKTKEEIRALAREALTPVQTSLGDDVFEAFKTKGVPFSKMKEYADYQEKQAKEAAKAEEDKVYGERVDKLTKYYENKFKDDSFSGRLKKGALRVGSELDVLTDYLNPWKDGKSDPETVAFLKASENMDEAFKKKHYTPEENLQNEANKKAVADANGTLDTIGTTAKDVYFNVTHPAGWDMAGLTAELLNPINAVGGGAGAVAGKVATKAVSKAAVGAATGAATEGAINAGYEYGVSKGRGQSDEEANKAALLGGAFGATFGGVTGGAGGVLHGRWGGSEKADTPSVEAATTAPDTPKVNDVVIPDDIKKSTLLKVTEAEGQSVEADKIITDVASQVKDPLKLDEIVVKYVPATAAETKLSLTINNDMQVHDRLAGARVRLALEKTMKNGVDTPESLDAKLAHYGFNDESRAKIVESYVKNDINIYDNFVADKLEQRAKGEADARTNTGNGRENTPVQTDRADTVTDGARETANTDTDSKTLQELTDRNRQDNKPSGLDTGNIDKETDLPTTDKTVDGQPTVRDDVTTLPRDRKDKLVQNENGVLADAKVEDTPLSKAGEVHEVNTDKFHASAVAAPTETNIPKFMLDFKEPVKTPIGELKINTDYLLNKAMARDSGLRANELHLIKPTLTDPAYVVKYRDAYNFIKPFKVDGKITKFLSVVSDKNGDIRFVTSHKMKGNGYKKILNEGDVVVDNVGGLLRTGAKSTGSRNLKPVTPAKSIAESTLSVKDIKTRDQLLAHRYFDDMVEMIKSEKAKEDARVKRVTPSEKVLELEKRGWDKSEDRYKAEMQKFFKKQSAREDGNFNTYSKKEMQLIESGKIDRPLAVKLREDLQGYVANPMFKKQREDIDAGTHFFASEIDVLKQLKADEVLGLVESDSFRKGFDEPLSVDEMVSSIDERVADVGKMKEMGNEVDALYGKESQIKLSQAQEKAILLTKDPMRRTIKRRKFEHKELKNRVKRAKVGKNKGAITKAQNNLKKWQDEFMRDGKIKKVGEC